MKKLWLSFALLGSIMCATSCKDNEVEELELKAIETDVTIHLNGEYISTRSTVTPTETSDSKINDLTVLVFRDDNSENSVDVIETLKSPSLSDAIKLKATTGKRIFYIVANIHETSLSGINNEGDFLEKLSDLKCENEGDFTMIGTLEKELVAGDNELNISLKRLVSRIVVSEIDADFTGTSYEGYKLCDVELFITNVQSQKYLKDGVTSPEDCYIINEGNYKASDSPTSGLTNIFYDKITQEVGTGSNSHTTKHFFYAYENLISDESSQPFTRLVLKGSINGLTYYWPININQEGFKGAATTDHDGVKANTTYEYKIKITRPGSSSAEDIIKFSNYNLSLTIEPWIETDPVNTEF